MSNIGDLWLGLHADTKTLQAEITKAGKVGGATFGSQMALSLKKSWSGGEMGKGLIQGLGLAGGLGAARLFSSAIAKVGDVLRDAHEAALDEEDSIARLTSSLKENVPAWDGNTDAIEKQMQARMRLGFADDEQRESIALLVGAVHDENKALDLSRTAMDLARFKKMSLVAASEALIKIEGGQFRALKALIGSTKDITTAEQAMAAVQKVAGGTAEKLANTNRGKLLASQIKVGEVMEKLGGLTMPVVVTVMTAFADLVEDLAVDLFGLGDAADKTGAKLGGTKGLFGEEDLGLIRNTQREFKQIGDVLAALGTPLGVVADSLRSEADAARLAAQESLDAAKAVGSMGPAVDEARHHINRGTTAVGKLGGAFGQSADDAAEARRRIVAASQRMVESLVGHARSLISDYFDIIENRRELAATNAELADLREIASKKKLTREQRARLTELERTQSELILDLAEKGATSGKTYQTAIDDLLKRLRTAHGKEKAMILAEIAALKSLAANAIVARAKVRAIDTGNHDPRHGGPEIRDSGGPTKDDTPYLVGLNRQAEIVVPGAGHILTQSQATEALAAGARAGSSYTVNVEGLVRAETPDDIGLQMRRLMALGLG